ncbi:nuclear transport factor 2 family protein [Tepidiforma sp.]|jgi:ketosteroid isomerase-like protein|uniref:nuclear transport factor 2 family protein n=1 Tax=Tepidiforma sp. TaxID=2682230 RepID=UPI002628BD6B|nr:nuclear transport factor 2 family protein [Tepidiforma sp.]MCX7618192.1 nuclear transport factor 2 family protein [Tepidiforma sp.]
MPLSVEDQLAIQQLYARYNHAIDSGDGAAWAACFTPDGTFSSATGTFTGRDQLQGFGAAFATRMKARHWTNNLVLEGDADAARGSCYLMLLRLTPGEQPPASILVTAIYRDELRRTADGWKFASRTVVGDS